MRLYRIDQKDIEAVMKAPEARATDDRGNARLRGETADGRPILVVVAADDPEFVITASFGADMRAEYDSTANAISIVIADVSRADASDEAHARGIVALSDGKPVEVQILYPDMGITEPLYAASARHGLAGLSGFEA
jgi:hypothetical protein